MLKLSVITPCFNGAKFIGRTIESVQAQTMSDWELIFVDDGSTDASYATALIYAMADPRIRVYRQQNRYLSIARNNGFGLTSPSTEFLLFLDADDLLLPQAFATMIRYLDDHPNVGAAYNLYRTIDANDRPLMNSADSALGALRFEPSMLGCFGCKKLPPAQASTPITALASYHQALPSCTYFRRDTFEAAGRWDSTFANQRVSAEDKDMIMRIALLRPVHMVAEALTMYRRHENNLSASGVIAGLQHLERLWSAKQFNNRSQRNAALRALTFNSYLDVTFALQRAGAMIRQGDIRHGAHELSRGIWRSRHLVRNVIRQCSRLIYPF